jgi:L-lactate utilization protein LutB
MTEHQSAHLETAVTNFTARNFHPHVVANGSEAIELIKTLIPLGSTIMNGASRTLEQIGFTELLKSGHHQWNNLHDAIHSETDPEKQAKLRRESVLSDAYLGSAHAVTEEGEILIASNTGSQLPNLVFTSAIVVLVVSTKKLVKDLPAAFERLNSVVLPLENERIRGQYGVDTVHAKTLILHRENPMLGRKVHVVFVQEDLGF